MDIAVIKKLACAAVVFVLSASVVYARPPEGGRGGQGPQPDFRRQEGNSFNGGSRQELAPEQAANQRRGKLSPDERRELRRQIDEAGQDIYRVKQ